MDKGLKLIAKIVALGLVVVALIFLISMIFDPASRTMGSSMLGGYLVTAYIAIGIAVFIALIFPIVRMIFNPKQALKGLLVVAGVFVLGLISYLLASNEFSPMELERLKVTENTSVWVGAGLNLTFIVGICTLLAAIFLAVKGTIKK